MTRCSPQRKVTASSQLRESGLIAKAPFSGRHAYWACPPPAIPVEPKTRSPVLNLETSLPAPTTSPANSVPRMRSFQGFPIPNMSFAIGIMDFVTKVKLRMLQSPVDTVDACTRIRTSLSLEQACPPPRTGGGRGSRTGCAESLSDALPLGLLSVLHVIRISCHQAFGRAAQPISAEHQAPGTVSAPTA